MLQEGIHPESVVEFRLALLAQGFSYKQVATRVSLTPRTVKYHVGEIMRKLHLSNRSQVLAYAGSRGMGPRPDQS